MQIVGVQRHVIKERTVGHLYNILLVPFWCRIVLKISKLPVQQQTALFDSLYPLERGYCPDYTTTMPLFRRTNSKLKDQLCLNPEVCTVHVSSSNIYLFFQNQQLLFQSLAKNRAGMALHKRVAMSVHAMRCRAIYAVAHVQQPEHLPERRSLRLLHSQRCIHIASSKGGK